MIQLSQNQSTGLVLFYSILFPPVNFPNVEVPKYQFEGHLTFDKTWKILKSIVLVLI